MHKLCWKIKYHPIKIGWYLILALKTHFSATHLKHKMERASQIFIVRVGIGENVFKVRIQRWRSYVYECVNAIMAKAHLLLGVFDTNI